MEFTPSFWLILALTLVLGWVLGFMSRSGGGKWKRELKTERERHALELKDRDARHAADLKDRDARIAASDARLSDYERARPVGDHRDDPRHRDSAIDNLDLTRRGGDPYPNDRDRLRP